MEKLSEFLLFNVEEKSVHLKIGCTYFQLPIQVKQVKNWPGMAVHELIFQMILFGEKCVGILVLTCKGVTPRFI